jgi:hypothetical protein
MITNQPSRSVESRMLGDGHVRLYVPQPVMLTQGSVGFVSPAQRDLET